VLFGTGIGLLLIFGLFTAYQWFFRDRFEFDNALLHQLQATTLADDSARTAQPGDWPQWRGPWRDGVSLETNLLTTWPEQGPPQLWEAAAGAGYSSFAVAAGRVFTMVQNGSDEAVLCWDAETGKERWRFSYPASYRNSMGDGPRATPTVDSDRVYTVGATGQFHCLEAATGKKLWAHDLLSEFHASNLQWGVSFSPLVEGDLVLTNPGGHDGSSIVAFDKHSGTVVWKALDDAAGYSSPIAITAAGQPQVICFTAAALVGLSPNDGTLLWRYPWVTQHGVNAATPIAFTATNSKGEKLDYVFISSGYGKGCALLKLEADAQGAPQVQRVYESNRMRNHFSSSVRHGDHIYGFDEDRLVCLDVLSGKVRWKQGGFAKGSLTIADGHLFILGENGKLAVAKASPERYQETASFPFSDQKCWTVPVVANGRLYVRDERRVVCYDLRKP
jgi:outer membrane protein assembly factor BamB